MHGVRNLCGGCGCTDRGKPVNHIHGQ
jgi:hypothetical protein